MSQDLDSIAASIETELEHLDTKARTIASDSQRRYRLSMDAGQAMPTFGDYSLADDRSRKEMRDAEREAFNEIMSVIDRALAADRRSMSAPANANDVATVQLALSRENIDEEELRALYERYGSNYQLATAIRERADKARVTIEGAPLKLDRAEGERRAARVTLGLRSSGSTTLAFDSPSLAARDIVDGLAHLDIFGRVYS